MLVQQLLFIFFAVFAAASPVTQSPSIPCGKKAAGFEGDEFNSDWNAIQTEHNAALERYAEGPNILKRINTADANNVAYVEAAYSALAAAVGQIKSILKWKQAREEFTQLATQVMLDHNPNPNQAVAAICYNKAYDIKDKDGIYGLTKQTLSVWPLHTDYHCFYMGRNNTFWSWGDGGTLNLYTRWYAGACRFDDQADLHCF
ncbi:hypothetical protein LY78DRAFT_729789 [Colletotrichum sublineola]|nr:hypothetical protein LY78DRAFT_729789 [Colletotrichum sublineola]